MVRTAKKETRGGPFVQLEKLLPQLPPERNIPPGFPSPTPPIRTENQPQDEGELFRQAMADVVPMDRDNIPEMLSAPIPATGCLDAEEEVLRQLERLVRHGEGFDWHRTPEYIEGSGYIVDRVLLRSLRRGDFAIQDHLDLHGLPVLEARRAFDAFLQAALREGKRALLIIHGRGLSSPAEPVLKNKVQQWLHRNRWRRWLLAYASARACDGGAGAVYVLLRRRPLRRKCAEKPPV